MELPDKKERGRPDRRFMDLGREDMQVFGVTEEDDAGDRRTWKQMIRWDRAAKSTRPP